MPQNKPESAPQTSRVFDAPTILFLFAVVIFLYAFLFIPPFIPIDCHGDGIVWLSDAKRMYEGEVIYRDFFEIVTPGAPLVYFLIFKIFGPSLWIPGATLIFLGLGLAIFSVMIGKKLMQPGTALVSTAIFIVGIYKNQLDPTHHWFSLLATLAALAVMMEKRTAATIAGAGAFCGLAACFTQTCGLAVVLGFGVFLWWEMREKGESWRQLFRKLAWLAAGFLSIFVVVNSYFVWKAGLSRFLWCTVVFVIKYGPKMADVNTLLVLRRDFPTLEELRTMPVQSIGALFLYIVIPLVYILVFVRYRRESKKREKEMWERPMLLAIVGSFLLLSVAPAPDYLRMSASALPGVILLGWLIDSRGELRVPLIGVLTLGILAVIPHAVAKAQAVKVSIVDTSQGKLAEANRDGIFYEEYTWVRQHTRPWEYFYKPADADFYFTLDLRNPTPMSFVVNSGFTTADQVHDVIRGLEQHRARFILWSRNQDGDLDRIPSWENPADDHLGPLREYLHRHYRVVKVFSNSDEIWGRVD